MKDMHKPSTCPHRPLPHRVPQRIDARTRSVTLYTTQAKGHLTRIMVGPRITVHFNRDRTLKNYPPALHFTAHETYNAHKLYLIAEYKKKEKKKEKKAMI